MGTGYDLIVASLSLHHLPLAERPDFYRRAYACLNPGGVLIAAEVIRDESPVVRDEQAAAWRAFMAANGEDATDWYRKHLEKDHPLSITTLVGMLAGAGFSAAGCWWRYVNFAIVSARRENSVDETNAGSSE